MERVVFLGPQDMVEVVRASLPRSYSVVWAEEEGAVDDALADATVVLDASMRIRFTKERISRAPRLKLYITGTTGADHVDSASLAERGIPLLTLKTERDLLRSLTPAAELSWLLVLACARGLPAAMADVREGRWDRTRHPGLMLRGRTIGIVGCGRIGQYMGRYAEAFGMHRVGYDPLVDPWPDHIARVDLATLLESSDIVTIHIPYDASTRGLVGEKELARMRPGAILVNTSRGEVVDEGALLKALESGHLRAAGLDVLAGEPAIADHPLALYARDHANLIITPHIGGFSPDAVRVVLEHSCRRIVAALGGA